MKDVTVIGRFLEKSDPRYVDAFTEEFFLSTSHTQTSDGKGGELSDDWVPVTHHLPYEINERIIKSRSDVIMINCESGYIIDNPDPKYQG